MAAGTTVLVLLTESLEARVHFRSIGSTAIMRSTLVEIVNLQALCIVGCASIRLSLMENTDSKLLQHLDTVFDNEPALHRSYRSKVGHLKR